MRKPVAPVGVGLALDQLGVVLNVLRVRRVVINQPNFASQHLKEPDGRVIAETQVPCGVDRQLGVVRDFLDAPLFVYGLKLLAVERAQNCGVEVAVILLEEQRLALILAVVLQVLAPSARLSAPR
jgi:hypothetical protein